jgi:DNA-binding NtrC family response regulator
MSRTILVVDDDPLVRATVEELLTESGYAVELTEGADAALALVADREFGLVLSDIRMPGKDGMELLPELRELRPGMPVILMTGYASIDSAVTAMREGAFDYITKPFRNEELLVSLERAFAYRTLERENTSLRRAVSKTSSYGDLIGKSPAMQEIYSLIERVASSTSNVLITGESGTGKEVVARTIHFAGIPRASSSAT